MDSRADHGGAMDAATKVQPARTSQKRRRGETVLPVTKGPLGLRDEELMHFHTADRSLCAVDVYETEAEYVIDAALPNLDLGHLRLCAVENRLALFAPQQSSAATRPHGKRITCERYAGPYNRVIVLPMPILADRVLATYENGLLRLRLVKGGEPIPSAGTPG